MARVHECDSWGCTNHQRAVESARNDGEVEEVIIDVGNDQFAWLSDFVQREHMYSGCIDAIKLSTSAQAGRLCAPFTIYGSTCPGFSKHTFPLDNITNP